MDEIWVPLADFPGYSVSSEGRIANDKRKKIVHQRPNQYGGYMVGLYVDGKQKMLAVRLLVARTFVEQINENYDTPINLDGDPANCSVTNLVWRPRHFAWKYSRQFANVSFFVGAGPIVNRSTGVMFEDIVKAATTYGLLFKDIQYSLLNKTPVFPTWQIFDWKEDNLDR